MKRLTVLSRSYCHLCDDMIGALKDLQSRFDFTFDVVDVDRRSEFEADWGDKVPVLLDGETEICHYFLNLDRLTQHLADTRLPP